MAPRSTVVVWLSIAVVGAAAMAFAAASLQQDLAAYWIAGKARWLGLDPYVNYCGSRVAPRLCDGVSVFRTKSGYTGGDIGDYKQPGSNGLAFDREGRLTIDEHGNRPPVSHARV